MFVPAPSAYGIPQSVIVRTQHWEPLIRWAHEFGWTQGAEIGVARGHVIFALLRGCPKLSMIGVDRWQHVQPRAEIGAEEYHDQATLDGYARDVKQRAAAFGKRCRILHMPHQDAVQQIENRSLDFIFADAGHTEAETRELIRFWRPKVRGWLTGHDYSWPSVSAALDAEVPGWEACDENVWRAKA